MSASETAAPTPRVPATTKDTATPEQAALLDSTRRQLGKVPNLYATLVASPAALTGYLALRESLLGGALTERLREQLALLTAQENDCFYCVSAHSFRGERLLKMTPAEVADTRHATDADPHAAAVLRLARQVIDTRGRIDDAQLAEAREHGVTDAELAEVVAHIALNTLSNYFNHLARPVLDFPPAPDLDAEPDADPDAEPVATATA